MLISSWFRTLFVRKPARLRTRLPIQQGLESLEDRKLPATFTVSNLLDNGSNGSLRWAVGQANATPGADDIVFQSGLTGTITLGGTQLGLTDTSGATTITGPGADLLTIDGNNASRIFYVGGGVSATLAGLTLTRGDAPYSNGGAILSYGNLIVLQTAITGNTADYKGGGISSHWSGSTVTITQSTVSGNSTGSNGGGNGGGIFGEGSVTVTQSTVSGNTADNGGGIWADGSVIVTQSTVSGNTAIFGGGIYANSSVTASNSLIVGNTDSYSDPDVEGSISDAGGNLIGVPNGFTLGQVVQVDGNGKPLLADNGGPTQTIALVPGSPAINAGDNSLAVDANNQPFTTDQRGLSRFVGTVDIGAVEADEAPSLVVTTSGDIVDPRDGLTSLREAIALANATPGTDTITFGDGSASGGTNFLDASADTITLGGSRLDLMTGPITITGPGADLLTIDGNNASRIFYVDSGVSATLAGLTLTRGYAPLSNGGAILSDGDLTVLQSAIRGNSANYGGGIFAKGSVTVTQSTVSGNSTNFIGGDGGGIFGEGSVTVTQSTVSGNTARRYGGGIRGLTGTVTVTQSTVSGNTADNGGGGILAQTAIVTQSTVSGNTADNGGGIFAITTVIVTQSTVSGNTADSRGGGIFADTAIVTQSTVSGNTAHSIGGGITAGTAIVTQSTVSGNTAHSIGGGIYAYDSGTASNSLIVGNTASNSGPDVDGSISDAGGSLIGVPNGFTLGQVVQVDGNGKPLLADNGGPTQTIALVPGSPAINAGDNSLAVDANNQPFTTDQRGLSRFVGTVDIGAVEADEAPSLVVTTNGDIVDPRDGLTSLREAIALANANPGTDTITFGDGSASGGTNFLDAAADTITLGGSRLDLTTGPITITGPGADLLTIDGNNASRIFYVGSGVSTTLAGLTLTRGYAPSAFGGAILSDGDLTVLQSAIRGNSADRGGGIFAFGLVTVTQSTVSGNTANYGGGILAVGSVTVTQSTVSGNTAHIYGGGIHTNTAIVTQSTVSGNTAHSLGGGITAGTAIVTQSTVSGNTAYEGGGIRAYTAIVTQSTVSGNTAFIGGGIYAITVIVTQSTVSGNTAHSTVGGIFAYYSVTASNSLIVGNTASYSAPDVEGSISDAGGNLIGVPNGFTLGQVVQVDGNGKPLLADNGGPTQTIALVPGSPAINAGNDALAVDEDGLPLTTDQRGKNRFVGTVDIGAVESQGYTLSVTGGDDQTALVDAVFSNPLAVEIIANDSDDPVNGGVITFAAPGSGASATLSATSATIVDGAVSVTATANSTPGSYTVEASASGANSVLFSLTNEQRQQPTTTSVNSQTVTYGTSSVTFTGTVAGGTSTPTGNVTVTISGNGITPITGSATLSASGQFSANFTNTVLSARPSSPYTVTVTYNGDAQHLGSEGSGTLTVNKASLTGNATTQDALNMAKQGKLTITVSNVAGLQNGDTLSQFLSTADFYITVGTNRYEFIPTTVTTSGSNITITYSMKNSALASSLAAELADNTSAATAAIAGFAIESDNYTLSDSYLTRLFSTIK